MKKILYIFVFLTQTLFANSYPLLLFHGNCITCHEINNAKSAPSIISIQKVYKNAFASQKEFVSYMAAWVQNPTVEGSLMYQAIEQYGLMPHLAYDKEVLEQIATFLYHHDFNKSD